MSCTELLQHSKLIASGPIVHYTVQFNLEGCKSSVSDMGPNTIVKIKNIIIRRLKSEITKISNIQSL